MENWEIFDAYMRGKNLKDLSRETGLPLNDIKAIVGSEWLEPVDRESLFEDEGLEDSEKKPLLP